MSDLREILVVPRRLFEDYNWFVPWRDVEPRLTQIAENMTWERRESAELSYEMVQIIPSGIIRNPEGKYCILRRNASTRADLRSKITLTIGGHVDRVEGCNEFLDLLSDTLLRELREELGISTTIEIRELGLIIDPRSTISSRHIAFIHEVTTDSEISPLAIEEFSTRSKYTAVFLLPEQLVELRSQMDPWSRLVLEEILAPACSRPEGRQFPLPLDV